MYGSSLTSSSLSRHVRVATLNCRIRHRRIWWRYSVSLVYKRGQSRQSRCAANGREESMKDGRLSLSLFVVALVFGSCAGAHAQAEITLFAVGPMRAPTQKIVDNFEAKTGYKVKVTYGNGAETRKMVAQGKPLDVNLLIAPFPGAVASGTIDPRSQTLVASILTALGVPKGRPHPDISTPAAVKKALLAAQSIGYEDTDFTAAAARPQDALHKLGIPD